VALLTEACENPGRTAGPSTALLRSSGRDDTFCYAEEFQREILAPAIRCHPDRSVAKWRDLRFSLVLTHLCLGRGPKNYLGMRRRL
jgi:hypothetical protein